MNRKSCSLRSCPAGTDLLSSSLQRLQREAEARLAIRVKDPTILPKKFELQYQVYCTSPPKCWLCVRFKTSTVVVPKLSIL